eukprot:scaffold32173_cov239-Skeletonema_dohrnii-CCMP3373.AAC.3
MPNIHRLVNALASLLDWLRESSLNSRLPALIRNSDFNLQINFSNKGRHCPAIISESIGQPNQLFKLLLHSLEIATDVEVSRSRSYVPLPF